MRVLKDTVSLQAERSVVDGRLSMSTVVSPSTLELIGTAFGDRRVSSRWMNFTAKETTQTHTRKAYNATRKRTDIYATLPEQK